jgi:LPS export ABC transporter permease LptG/LPS export ABC transporter permease LptF
MEVLGPVTLGFLVYTFLLLMQFLFRSAEMIVRRDVPADIVGKLLGLTIPNIVVLTIPMALLFGVLVGMGRLSSDSELVALRSCGISLYQLYRPILVLSLLLTGVNVFLMVWTLPRANHALQQLRVDIVTGSSSKQIEPRVFYEDWQGLVLYIFDAPPDVSHWEGVFVAEDPEGSSTGRVTVAEKGEVRFDEANDRLMLHLENALVHEVDLENSDRYKITRFNSLEQVLVDRFASDQRMNITKGVRELTVPELRQRLRTPGLSQEMRNITEVEIHKKFSIPVATAVFGLLALPLGVSGSRSSSKSSGFAMSIAIIMMYYIILNNGEEMARVGKMSAPLAMWLPNVVFTIAGVFLIIRRNSDRSLLLGRLDSWFRKFSLKGMGLVKSKSPREEPGSQETLGVDAVSDSDGRTDVVLRLPRLRLKFPNLLDRYVVRMFTGVVVLVLLSGVAISVVADLSDRIDEIFRNDVPFSVIFDYYRYLSLQLMYEISPMAVLVTTLVIFGLLSKTNEVTAAKSLGISLYRLAVPAIVAAILIAILGGFLQTTILPATNEKVAQLKDRIRGRTAARSYRRADRQWLFGQGRYIYNYQSYDDREKVLEKLQVFEFDDRGGLTRRLYSGSTRYLGDAWLFDEGWVRAFEGGEVLEHRDFDQPVIDYYPETPDYFESEYKLPDAMTYGELRKHIREIQGSGQAVPDLEVEMHKKISLPFASIVMALVALPFSFRLGRKGTLYGVGIGIVLGMVFYAMLAFTSTLGETGALPPLVAVWSPNIAFMILSLYLLLGVRS